MLGVCRRIGHNGKRHTANKIATIHQHRHYYRPDHRLAIALTIAWPSHMTTEPSTN